MPKRTPGRKRQLIAQICEIAGASYPYMANPNWWSAEIRWEHRRIAELEIVLDRLPERLEVQRLIDRLNEVYPIRPLLGRDIPEPMADRWHYAFGWLSRWHNSAWWTYSPGHERSLERWVRQPDDPT